MRAGDRPHTFRVELPTFQDPNMATTFWLLRTFGERQMMTRLITRRLLVSPLINAPGELRPTAENARSSYKSLCCGPSALGKDRARCLTARFPILPTEPCMRR